MPKPSNKILYSTVLTILIGFVLFILLSFLIKPKTLEIIPKESPTEESPTLTLLFTGDIMLDRGVEYYIEKEGKGDYKFPFLKIADYLQKADILVGNLEGPISDKGVKAGSIYSFRMNPKAIEGLTYAGFDILSLANNHMFDYTKEALTDTLSRLKEAKIDYIGGGSNQEEAYSPLIKELNGTKIAFLAYTNLGSPNWAVGTTTSGISWLSEENLKKGIESAKEKADIIIVSFHIGEEYLAEPDATQKYFSKLAVDYGADFVVSHHPHVVQKQEIYKGKYIFYSLGNFVFDQGFSEKTKEGQILKISIKENKIQEITPINIKMNEFFQPEMVEPL
ncbi:MAG: CapA family protein [Candidatus Paceibacterota bacterium]